MCSHVLRPTKKEPCLRPRTKRIPSGWNECLPHAPMSGTHNHLEWSFGVLWACQLRVETPTDQEKLAGYQTVPY